MGYTRQPLVLQHISGAGPIGGVDGKTALDEVLGRLGDVLPVPNGLKCEVTSDYNLLLLPFRLPVERPVTREEEVGGDTHSPDVHRFAIASWMVHY